MKDRLILFVADRGFIVPTLVAARQVMAQPAVMRIADVMVALVEFSPSEVNNLQKAFSSSEIQFVSLNVDSAAVADVDFATTHVTFASIARLLTPALIPSAYQHIIYLDGDIQVLGDLLPLIMHDVPDGRLLAANDRLTFSKFRFGELAKFWRETKQYMASLGLTDESEYFNAGVLAARRDTWAEVCGMALVFLQAHTQDCQFHDQSALNAVCSGRREVLSPRYNFATGLAELMDYKKVRPAIVHFTGAKKPWLFEDVPVWGAAFGQAYQEILLAVPLLQRYAQDWPRLRAERAVQPGRKASSLKAIIADIWYRMDNRKRLRGNIAQAIRL